MVIGFDLDGTLVDSLDLSAQWMTAACSKAIGQPISEALVRSHFGRPEPDILREILKPEPAELAFSYYQEILSRECGQMLPYPGAKEILTFLRSRRVPLALFTSRGAWATAQILERHGLGEFFAMVLTGDQVKKVKPDPEGILKICQALNASPADFLYIGDSPDDMKAAESAGARGYHALWAKGVQPFGASHLRSLEEIKKLLPKI